MILKTLKALCCCLLPLVSFSQSTTSKLISDRPGFTYPANILPKKTVQFEHSMEFSSFRQSGPLNVPLSWEFNPARDTASSSYKLKNINYRHDLRYGLWKNLELGLGLVTNTVVQSTEDQEYFDYNRPNFNVFANFRVRLLNEEKHWLNMMLLFEASLGRAFIGHINQGTSAPQELYINRLLIGKNFKKQSVNLNISLIESMPSYISAAGSYRYQISERSAVMAEVYTIPVVETYADWNALPLNFGAGYVRSINDNMQFDVFAGYENQNVNSYGFERFYKSYDGQRFFINLGFCWRFSTLKAKPD